MSTVLKNPLTVAIVAGLVLALIASRKAAQVVEAVNPLNNNNVVAKGFNDIIGVSEEGGSLGSSIFDFFHDEFDPNADTSDNTAGRIF